MRAGFMWVKYGFQEDTLKIDLVCLGFAVRPGTRGARRAGRAGRRPRGGEGRGPAATGAGPAARAGRVCSGRCWARGLGRGAPAAGVQPPAQVRIKPPPLPPETGEEGTGPGRAADGAPDALLGSWKALFCFRFFFSEKGYPLDGGAVCYLLHVRCFCFSTNEIGYYEITG